MSTVKYARNDNVVVNVISRDENSAPITNAALQITWQKQSNKEYWTGTGSTFQASPVQIAMTEIDETNSPGLWEFLFPSSGIDPDTYLGVITDTSGNAVNVPLHFTAIVGDTLAMFQEWAAAGAIGKAEYNAGTSVLTLTFVNGTDTLLFNMKDAVGNPAGSSAFFQKVPQ